jgi:hypothetical protein
MSIKLDFEYDSGRMAANRWLSHKGARHTNYDNQQVQVAEAQLSMLVTISKQLEVLRRTVEDLSVKIRAQD